MKDVEPGGHFFGTAHTMARYKSAFYDPLVADYNNHGGWVEAGSLSSSERATAIWQDRLENFQPPANSESIEERLRPYIEKKSAEGGAPPVD